MTQESSIKKAPPGFSLEQWRTFRRDGLIHLEGMIEPDRVAEYLAAAEECMSGMVYDTAHTNKVENVIRVNPAFHDLIDHERHVGFAYDIFGDQLRLSQNDLFVRPPGSVVNQWHVDGARVLPYRVFSPILPLKLRIGYWLTDLPQQYMGNMVYLPGSHDPDYAVQHKGTDDVLGQRVLTCSAGSITIFHASLWHRIQGNQSSRTRINAFLSYTPSWVSGYYFQDEKWASELTREQRIILRPYGADQERFVRPPAADLPLFYDPEAPGTDPDIEAHKQRRLTRYERTLSAAE